MDLQKFEEKIAPFYWYWVEYSGYYTLCLDAGDYKSEIFESRYEEGFEGNGYDWQSLAVVFMDEKMPEIKEDIFQNSEGGTLCLQSRNKVALEQFALAFKAACEDDFLIRDLFSRAELD